MIFYGKGMDRLANFLFKKKKHLIITLRENLFCAIEMLAGTKKKRQHRVHIIPPIEIDTKKRGCTQDP